MIFILFIGYKATVILASGNWQKAGNSKTCIDEESILCHMFRYVIKASASYNLQSSSVTSTTFYCDDVALYKKS
jgi:hypothetical protein